MYLYLYVYVCICGGGEAPFVMMMIKLTEYIKKIKKDYEMHAVQQQQQQQHINVTARFHYF